MDWLTTRVADLGITVHTLTSLERIIFDSGTVIGAVITTPHGSRSIRARHGVTLAPPASSGRITTPDNLTPEQQVQIGIVSRTASRFGRVELLITTPPSVKPNLCRGLPRRLHNPTRYSRISTLRTSRCLKT